MILLASIGTMSHAVWQNNRRYRNFSLIQNGDSQQKVKDLIGRPSRITKGTESEYGYQRLPSEISPKVAEEFWYYSLYAPEVWSISFDQEKTVVATAHLISP
jgi:hypothetical protein